MINNHFNMLTILHSYNLQLFKCLLSCPKVYFRLKQCMHVHVDFVSNLFAKYQTKYQIHPFREHIVNDNEHQH